MKTINQKNTEQIIECFTQIVTYTKLHNKLGQYDFSKELELVTKDILNTLFDFNFKFLESEQKNHPGIDLGDKKKKIAVQVTSQNTKNKITTTLSLFKKHNLEKNYSKLLIVIWDLEKVPTTVKSDISYEIMTPVDFINVFKGLNDSQQNKFIRYLSTNFGLLKQTFHNRILTNKKAVLPNTFDNLYSILEINDCEIDKNLKHDINLVLKQFGNNLELLSPKERQLLYDCLTVSKNINDEYLLLTQGVGKRISEENLSDAFENLVKNDFIESDFEYDDGCKTGAIFIFDHEHAFDNLNWLWLILKNNFNRTELNLLIIGMDLRIFEN